MKRNTLLKLFAISPALLLATPLALANPAQNVNSHTVPMNAPTQQAHQSIPTTAMQMTSINKQNAIQIALDHAGFTKSQVNSLWTDRDSDDGRLEYEIDFKKDGYEYEYKINGNTGQIISHQFEKSRFNLLGDLRSDPNQVIQADYAKKIALDHAGFQENQVMVGEFHYDVDDGEHIYDITFYVNNIEYDYEINAENGEIFKCKIDYHI